MKKNKILGLTATIIGILIMLWGIFSETIGTVFIPIFGLIISSLGIALYVKMKNWYWIIIAFVLIFIVYFSLVLFIPYK